MEVKGFVGFRKAWRIRLQFEQNLKAQTFSGGGEWV
jgi:hypothetical protein